MDEAKGVEAMTDTQAKRADLQARLDELDRIAGTTTDRDVLEYIAARKTKRRLGTSWTGSTKRQG